MMILFPSILSKLSLPLCPACRSRPSKPRQSAFAGQALTVTWGVTNVGDGSATLPWVDAVFLSSDGLIDNTAVQLGTAQNAAFLNPGESYLNTQTFTLPAYASGNYYIIVQADAGDRITEFAHTNNIGLSSSILVETPPLADLQVARVIAPVDAFSGQTASLSWTVVNGGDAPGNSSGWVDFIYLSTNQTFDASAQFLTYGAHYGDLPAGASYTLTNSVLLPQGISGTYYFFINADADQAVTELTYANNIAAANPTHVFLTPPPDLAVVQVTAPPSGLASHNVTLSYVVANNGATTTPEYGWIDTVYLSPTTNSSQTITLGTFPHNGYLSPGQSYTNTIVPLLPNGLSGSFYIFVDTDSSDQVFELNKANNTAFDPSPISLASVLPDLVATIVQSPASVVPGSAIPISWTVDNLGGGDSAASVWYDSVLLSTSPSGGIPSGLGTVYHFGLLGPGQSYTVTNQYIGVPYGLPFGTYYLTVQADSGNAVYEGAAGAAKISSPVAITVSAPPADLAAGDLSAPGQVNAGSVAYFTWTATNLGPAATAASFWQDSVYLFHRVTFVLAASNNLPLAADLPLAGVVHSGALPVGAVYTNSLFATIPQNLSGPYTAYVIVDSQKQVVEDIDRSNTVAIATNSVSITSASLAALVVSDVSAPVQAFSSQPALFSWTVANEGEGPADSYWYDSVYLSLDQFLDPNSAIYVGSAPAALSSYSGLDPTVRTNYFTIPASVPGTFGVFVVANAGQNQPETNDFELGTEYDPTPIQISPPPPADLRVTSVTIPASGVPGQEAAIEYVVTNLGSGPIEGTWEDSVYLSTTGQWNAIDPLLGTITVRSGAPEFGYTNTLYANFPALTPGNYYIIVRPDILNNLNENTELTHSGASTSSTSMNVPVLTLGVVVTQYPPCWRPAGL